MLLVSFDQFCDAFLLPPQTDLPFSSCRRGRLWRSSIRSSRVGDSKSESYASSVIPMNTPARQSIPDHIELRPIPGKGLGVITRVPIPRNTVVGDYRGEVMTSEVKDRRYLVANQHLRQPEDLEWAESRRRRGQTTSGDYLYGVTMPGGVEPMYIDAEDEYESLWTRFLNHAAPPGNNVNPKSIHQSYDGKPRVWFVSNRDILAGEELCFDYGDDYWLPGDKVF